MNRPFDNGELVRPIGCEESGEVVDCYPVGFINWRVKVAIAGGTMICQPDNLMRVGERLPARIGVVAGTDTLPAPVRAR